MSDHEEPQDSKAQADEHINIKVVDANHAETYFKIKMTTKLGKLMTAYADRNGQDRSAVKFLYDGQRIAQDDTPAKLDMEDNDSIDVVIEQVGGQ
ncbi:ubiquitin-like protein [Cystobasidium minutum MCA 4210]|uniref:ubiquitin-like protein n=1 Tax=Cystobasidium minutum MCA 4210 TaxID=1397322 RepID=UPI0034CE17F3|eukprot:jgi/Rhomi1/165260/fgenesh1_kg.1_\